MMQLKLKDQKFELKIYSTLGRGGSASDSFPNNFHLTLEGGRFYSSELNIDELRLRYIENRLDSHARLPIQTDPSDPNSWVYSARPTNLNGDTLIKISFNSPIDAITLYQTYLNEPAPLWATDNKIKYSELINPRIFYLILAEQLQFDNQENFSFASNKSNDFHIRKQWFEDNWMIWTTIINKIQRLKSGISNQGRGALRVAIWDTFNQIQELLPTGRYNKAWRPFSAIRGIGTALNENFSGLGDKFMRWMLNSRVNIIGWQTWKSVDVTAHGGYNLFNNQQDFNRAQNLINILKAISNMGRDSFYGRILENRRISELFSREKFISFLNNFTESLTGMQNIKILCNIKLHHLRDLIRNTESWESMPYIATIMIDYITSYLKSIFSLSDLNFNNFMTTAIPTIHSQWNWNVIPNRLTDLNQFINGRRYFGARDPVVRLIVPVDYGIPNQVEIINLDSTLEFDVLETTFKSSIGGKSTIIPVNSPQSHIKQIFGREVIRHRELQRVPKRLRISGLDGTPRRNGNPLWVLIYYDALMHLKEGKAFALEIDGGKGLKYIKIKDLNTKSCVILRNIPVINIVPDDLLSYYMQVRHFDGSFVFMGNNSPLLSKSEWISLNIAMINNQTNNHLTFEQMLAELDNNYNQYRISHGIAITLQKRFGMDTSCVISETFTQWWNAFRNSDNLIINGHINLFHLHVNRL